MENRRPAKATAPFVPMVGGRVSFAPFDHTTELELQDALVKQVDEKSGKVCVWVPDQSSLARRKIGIEFVDPSRLRPPKQDDSSSSLRVVRRRQRPTTTPDGILRPTLGDGSVLESVEHILAAQREEQIRQHPYSYRFHAEKPGSSLAAQQRRKDKLDAKQAFNLFNPDDRPGQILMAAAMAEGPEPGPAVSEGRSEREKLRIRLDDKISSSSLASRRLRKEKLAVCLGGVYVNCTPVNNRNLFYQCWILSFPGMLI